MKDIVLDNPSKVLDEEILKNDISFALEKGLTQGFLRRRIVFFMDGYRYAHEAAQKRWGVHFIFYEFGHDTIKKVFQSDNLNPEAAKVWMDMMDKDPSFGQSLVKELQGIIEIQNRLVETIPAKSLTPASVQESLKELLSYWIEFFELAFLWFGVDPIKEATDVRIREEWKGSQDELDSFLEHVYRPMKQPLSSVEQRDLVSLVSLEGEDFEAALGSHHRKYRHLALHNIDDEVFDLEYYRGRANTLKDPSEYEQQKDMLDAADEEMGKANKLLETVDLSPEIKQRIEFVRWFMYLRTESIDHMMMVNGAYRPLFDYLAQLFELPIEAVLDMTYKEIIDSLVSGSLAVPKEEVLERTENGYAYFIGPEHSVLVVGEDVERLDSLCRPHAVQEAVKEFKGQIAFKGKVRAPARVILDRRKASELKEGEILVTAMTSPDFVPAMKLSSGIITNEGGVLCHAAIMSRELRKPCVIGTKIATDVIKTGQMITLDADQGLITLEDS
jgi:phosphohistidine swiveling domain-containing protein